MLAVTEDARTRLAQMLEQEGVPQENAVRLVNEGNAVMLQSDVERPGDETVEHSGRTVLVLDAQVSELLAESTLDIDGAKLTLRRLNPDD